MLYKVSLLSYFYYINEEEVINFDLCISDNFFIFENNNFIITHNIASLRHFKFSYFPYPPNKLTFKYLFNLMNYLYPNMKW